MKKLLVLAILPFIVSVRSLFFQSLFAEEPMVRPHMQHSSPETLTKVREEMEGLEYEFMHLQSLNQEPFLDYETIKKVVQKMEESAGKIRSLNTDRRLDRPLLDLQGKIRELKKMVEQKRVLVIRKEVDTLLDACFSCHNTHRQTRRD
jgi:cytochrome c556